MGFSCKAVDTLLLVVFTVMLFVGPLIDAQLVFPETAFPEVLVRLKQRYADEFQDYLVVEKPNFFVALGNCWDPPKASDKLLTMYSPFMGVGVLALLRGLVPHSGKSQTVGKGPAAVARKKRA
ncbi:putative Ras-related small GTP-binding family protein [Hibiscus syriacus]|uniref:Ras-related small GTP-binding family protein n=1 Tax=Hibiscus syriacus TaxID=106335 RepID=A0A6A2XS30_HIBSY|nr:putative Ras-related small GTP-binding family protein [Hibiscus syriacus]